MVVTLGHFSSDLSIGRKVGAYMHNAGGVQLIIILFYHFYNNNNNKKIDILWKYSGNIPSDDVITIGITHKLILYYDV